MITEGTTTLSIAQHNRLDLIADEDPGAKVVNWDFQGRGPLVRYSDGRKRAINPHGRPLPRRLQAIALEEDLVA